MGEDLRGQGEGVGSQGLAEGEEDHQVHLGVEVVEGAEHLLDLVEEEEEEVELPRDLVGEEEEGAVLHLLHLGLPR